MKSIAGLIIVGLMGTAGTIATTDAVQEDAAKAFAANCAMCHGATGMGDGMAAAAMNPKPTNFTDAEYQESRTDEEITAAITTGKGAMPAYEGKLSADAIAGLVAYIRELGKQ